MGLRRKFLISFLMLGFAIVSNAQNKLEVYPAPVGADLIDDFTVQVREPGKECKNVDTYSVKVDGDNKPSIL